MPDNFTRQGRASGWERVNKILHEQINVVQYAPVTIKNEHIFLRTVIFNYNTIVKDIPIFYSHLDEDPCSTLATFNLCFNLKKQIKG